MVDRIWAPPLAVALNCTCALCCHATCLANDGRVLNQIDPRVREPHKVDPKCAGGTAHFHVDLADNLDSLMKTCANASCLGKKVRRKLEIQRARKAETHLSQFPDNVPPCPALNPPLSHDFTRRFSPPSPAAVRALFKSACCLPRAPRGCLHFDRSVRERFNASELVQATPSPWTGPFRPSRAAATCLMPRLRSLQVLDKPRKCLPWSLHHQRGRRKRRTCSLKFFLRNGRISIRLFFVRMRATTTRILGGCSLAPISKCALGCSIHCIALLTLSTPSVTSPLERGLVALKKSVCRHDDNDITGLFKALQDGTFSRDRKKRSLFDRQFGPLFKELRSALEKNHSAVWPDDCASDPHQTLAKHKDLQHFVLFYCIISSCL